MLIVLGVLGGALMVAALILLIEWMFDLRTVRDPCETLWRDWAHRK